MRHKNLQTGRFAAGVTCYKAYLTARGHPIRRGTTNGPGTIANTHACAAIRSFVSLESDSVELEHCDNIIQTGGKVIRDGYIEMTNRTGLGIALNDDVCRAHLAEGSGYFESFCGASSAGEGWLPGPP